MKEHVDAEANLCDIYNIKATNDNGMGNFFFLALYGTQFLSLLDS